MQNTAYFLLVISGITRTKRMYTIGEEFEEITERYFETCT